MHSECACCGSQDNGEDVVAHLEFQTKNMGVLLIPDIPHTRCVNCGTALSIPGSSAKLVDIYINSLQSDLVAGLPVGMFIPRAAAIALASTYDPGKFNLRRFENLTYRVKIGSSWWCYKPSVEAYMKTGDGRISLIGN
jgi:hypothetical protein